MCTCICTQIVCLPSMFRCSFSELCFCLTYCFQSYIIYMHKCMHKSYLGFVCAYVYRWCVCHLCANCSCSTYLSVLLSVCVYVLVYACQILNSVHEGLILVSICTHMYINICEYIHTACQVLNCVYKGLILVTHVIMMPNCIR
jgi:hypothetical protein